MKKTNFLPLLFLLFLLTSGFNPVSAQLRFGVKGGVDIDNNSLDLNKIKANSRLGYQIGPTIEYIYPASGLGADISLLYARKQYKIEDKQIDASISDFNYVSIPLNIKQRIALSPSFGLFFTGGFYGNVKINGGNIKSVVNDVFREYTSKSFAFGVGAGAGVNVFKHLDIGISFRGDLTHRYNKEYMDAGIFQNKKNQSWTAGLNYYF